MWHESWLANCVYLAQERMLVIIEFLPHVKSVPYVIDIIQTLYRTLYRTFMHQGLVISRLLFYLRFVVLIATCIVELCIASGRIQVVNVVYMYCMLPCPTLFQTTHPKTVLLWHVHLLPLKFLGHHLIHQMTSFPITPSNIDQWMQWQTMIQAH